MATNRSYNSNRSFQYSTYSESTDSSDDASEGDSGCSGFYRQKVRFTRTTSKVQHHMEARATDGGRHLFGCLRRASSNSHLSQYMERSWKDDKTLPNQEAERRRQELEKTRQEVKRMDTLLLEQQREERKSLRAVSSSQKSLDGWIEDLSSSSEPPNEDWNLPKSSAGSSGCWDWCVSGQSSWPPHINLEPFTGDPKHWPEFIQGFKTWIHDAMPNDTLRMIYLEELLSSGLKKKYASFLSYPNCYRKLLLHLRDRHGHPVLIARACFEAFRQLPSVDPGNTKSSLTTLSNKVQQIMDVLKMAGCASEFETFSALELSGLSDKLTEDLHDNWNIHLAERASPLALPNLGEFAVWLNQTATWWS